MLSITGGFYSPDIHVYEATGSQQLGPEVQMPRSLVKGRPYHLAARIYNNTEQNAPASNVDFSYLLGGVALNQAQEIGFYNGPIAAFSPPPGPGIVIIANDTSGNYATFTAPNGTAGVIHGCFIVRVNGVPLTVPSPSDNGKQRNIAWRNIDSTDVQMRVRATFTDVLAATGTLPNHPTVVNISAFHVSANWRSRPEVADATETLASAGSNYPIYMLRGLQHTLPKVDLGVALKSGEKGVKVTKTGNSAWEILAEHGTSGIFHYEGTLPAQAQPGDVFLVKTNAIYPSAGVTTEFTLVVQVV
jgi:hypothetical protein